MKVEGLQKAGIILLIENEKESLHEEYNIRFSME